MAVARLILYFSDLVMPPYLLLKANIQRNVVLILQCNHPTIGTARQTAELIAVPVCQSEGCSLSSRRQLYGGPKMDQILSLQAN